jgi:SNF2 family DNA or RNA helicase
LNWLLYCWANYTNSILADEMGLGKTAQALAILELLRTRYNVSGPFLVIAPLSTLSQWKREAESWTEMNSVLFHGSATDRAVIREFEFHYRSKVADDDDGDASMDEGSDERKARKNGRHVKRPPGRRNPFKFDLLITSYETLRAEDCKAFFSRTQWTYMVIDEAHRLKNKASKMASDVKEIQADQILLLTGTPVQNNTSELFSLLTILDPTKFPSAEAFESEFGDLKSAEQVERLQAFLKPLLLRRMKEHVESSIAAKEETIVEVELTTLQKKYYRAIFEKNRAFLRTGCKGSAVPSLINVVMELRKCCNHPYLIKGVE